MRSVLSTQEASLDSLDALDVVTSVVAIRDQGVDGERVWPNVAQPHPQHLA
jgi:hypothetical protein